MGVLLHHSIDEAAARETDREAFRFDGIGIGYTDLVKQSNRLANLLIDRGVKRNDRVGIYMNKGLELPVALYGILKAGAAYVPIDPGAPPARVQFMIEDCGIRHLVTNASRAKQAVGIAAGVGVGDEAATDARQCVRSVIGASPHSGGEDSGSSSGAEAVPWEALDEVSSDDPDVSVGESDLAYIMYTSGSTGSPKGLMHTHASGHSYAELSAREYDVRSDDRLGNHSPLHFDMSAFEYLTGPLCGATTVIIPEETTMFPVSLAELIETERLTFWYSVPLALIQLLERGHVEERDLSSLRWVLFGGEPFPPKHLARLAALLPGSRFSNSYGPAEVNQCTAYHVPAGPIDADDPIPIGPVWPGAEGLIVDKNDNRVARGEPGELLIHAPTMMRGYWNRPDLTGEAFFREEARRGDAKVFYRTGDLVSERADGNLMFLGRKDRQIKVRGYRVELDEVESVVSSLPGVAEAAAVDVRDAEGNVDIVAVVLPRDGVTVSADDLRGGAARKLSSYAVPSSVDIRKSLPRTGTGKIDRRALKERYEAG